MPTVYVMCGLAFAGKSRAAARLASALGAALVSLDALHAERGLDPGRDIAVATWAETGRRALARLQELLIEGRSVVMDDTFSYRAERQRVRDLAARHGAAVRIVFLDPPDEILEARIATNLLRPARPHVIPEVVEHIRREFERPGADEPAIRLTEPDAVEEWIRHEAGTTAYQEGSPPSRARFKARKSRQPSRF